MLAALVALALVAHPEPSVIELDIGVGRGGVYPFLGVGVGVRPVSFLSVGGVIGIGAGSTNPVFCLDFAGDTCPEIRHVDGTPWRFSGYAMFHHTLRETEHTRLELTPRLAIMRNPGAIATNYVPQGDESDCGFGCTYTAVTTLRPTAYFLSGTIGLTIYGARGFARIEAGGSGRLGNGNTSHVTDAVTRKYDPSGLAVSGSLGLLLF